jgi:large subunit ribosomal protein L6
MSRIGKKPIEIPAGVTYTLSGNTIEVKGPLGSDSCSFCEGISIKEGNNTLLLEVTGDQEDKDLNAKYGLYRSLIANVVTGVSKGFEKDLEIQGVGYRAQQQGKDVQLFLGFSHPVVFEAPEGITIKCVDQTNIKVSGINKQKVGQVAANIRKIRPPEPYKGKGVRYKDEYVRRKAGKAGK